MGGAAATAGGARRAAKKSKPKKVCTYIFMFENYVNFCPKMPKKVFVGFFPSAT